MVMEPCRGKGTWSRPSGVMGISLSCPGSWCKLINYLVSWLIRGSVVMTGILYVGEMFHVRMLNREMLSESDKHVHDSLNLEWENEGWVLCVCVRERERERERVQDRRVRECAIMLCFDWIRKQLTVLVPPGPSTLTFVACSSIERIWCDLMGVF